MMLIPAGRKASNTYACRGEGDLYLWRACTSSTWSFSILSFQMCQLPSSGRLKYGTTVVQQLQWSNMKQSESAFSFLDMHLQ